MLASLRDHWMFLRRPRLVVRLILTLLLTGLSFGLVFAARASAGNSTLLVALFAATIIVMAATMVSG